MRDERVSPVVVAVVTLLVVLSLATYASDAPDAAVSLTAGHLVAGAALALFLSQIGVVAWVRWSFDQIATKAATEAAAAEAEKLKDELDTHMGDKFAHPEAAEHYHAALNAKLDKIIADSDAMKQALLALLTEHQIIMERNGCATVRRRGNDGPELTDALLLKLRSEVP